MIKKRPEDKSILKYWLPYGYMRRHLASRYGMVVREGVLTRGRPTPAETSGFRFLDLLPLWVVMGIQAKGGGAGTVSADKAELSRLKSAVQRLEGTVRSERYAFACQIDQLKVQNLKLQLQIRQAAQLFGLKDGGAPLPRKGGGRTQVKTANAPVGPGYFVRPAESAWNAWTVLNALRLEVDMICSLGGDCIAASQQKVRGLRHYSLPFDWCFSDGEMAVEKFADELEHDFTGFAKRENLQPIPGVRFGYKDVATGYNFMHHFHADLNDAGEYARFREVLDRRLDRFRAEIARAKTVLFLLSRTFRLDESSLRKVQAICRRKWPDKRFCFILVTYNSKSAAEMQDGDFSVVRIARDRTQYDIHEKAFEWSFLDNVKYTKESLAYFQSICANCQ